MIKFERLVLFRTLLVSKEADHHLAWPAPSASASSVCVWLQDETRREGGGVMKVYIEKIQICNSKISNMQILRE